MKNPALALLALTVLAAAPAIQAQDGTAYYGLSIGEFDYSEGDGLGGVFEDSADSWRLMVGYQFMDHLAVEGSYGKTSTIRDSVTVPTFPIGSFEGGFETELSKILTIRIIGVLPFDNGFELMGGVGYADLEQEVVLSRDGVPFISGEFSDNRPTYYFGVGYNWDRVGLRLSYEKFDFDGDVDGEETSLTFFYRI